MSEYKSMNDESRSKAHRVKKYIYGASKFKKSAKPEVKRTPLSPAKTKRNNRGFKKRRAARMSRKQLLDLLTVPNHMTSQYGDQILVAASSATAGVKAAYGHINNGLAAVGSCNPAFMKTIAYTITTAVQPDIMFEQTHFEVNHHLANQLSNPIQITGYLCESRHDQPVAASEYPLTRLGQGFASAGIDPTNPNSTNAAMAYADTDPFMSPEFCESWKIIKTKKVWVQPGKVAHFHIKDKKCHVIRPNRFLTMASGNTYNTSTSLLQQMQGEQFWLFKTENDYLGNLSTTKTTLQTIGYRVNILSDVRYTYKYVQDNQSTLTTVVVSGIATASGITDSMLGGYNIVAGQVSA